MIGKPLSGRGVEVESAKTQKFVAERVEGDGLGHLGHREILLDEGSRVIAGVTILTGPDRSEPRIRSRSTVLPLTVATAGLELV